MKWKQHEECHKEDHTRHCQQHVAPDEQSVHNLQAEGENELIVHNTKGNNVSGRNSVHKAGEKP